MPGYLLVVSMEYHYGAHTSTYMNALSGMHSEKSGCLAGLALSLRARSSMRQKVKSIIILILILICISSDNRTGSSSTDTTQQQLTKTPVSCIF